uniref:Uncharacterized protein n=1 Tax=Arundo donax TaxID=35708 RepID=A0A0A8ZN32_ARUDO
MASPGQDPQCLLQGVRAAHGQQQGEGLCDDAHPRRRLLLGPPRPVLQHNRQHSHPLQARSGSREGQGRGECGGRRRLRRGGAQEAGAPVAGWDGDLPHPLLPLPRRLRGRALSAPRRCRPPRRHPYRRHGPPHEEVRVLRARRRGGPQDVSQVRRAGRPAPRPRPPRRRLAHHLQPPRRGRAPPRQGAPALPLLRPRQPREASQRTAAAG